MRANPLSTLTEQFSDEFAPALMPDAPCMASSAASLGSPSEASPSDMSASEPSQIDAEYDELVTFHGIERERLVLIHPGSHKHAPDTPAWSEERYADVADQLAADGWQIAIVGDASAPERTAGVLGAMQTAALFLAGVVAPRTLPRLIADARLILSDDAAPPSPVAAARALGTPHIVLDEQPRDIGSETIARRARAKLSDTERAHPGQPYTLHMSAIHHAL